MRARSRLKRSDTNTSSVLALSFSSFSINCRCACSVCDARTLFVYAIMCVHALTSNCFVLPASLSESWKACGGGAELAG